MYPEMYEEVSCLLSSWIRDPRMQLALLPWLMQAYLLLFMCVITTQITIRADSKAGNWLFVWEVSTI